MIIGIEARGFLIGPIMAQQLGVPFVAIRKKGKLPRECYTVKYEKVIVINNINYIIRKFYNLMIVCKLF